VQDPWILPPERQALATALRGPVTVVGFPGQGHGGSYVYADPARWDGERQIRQTALVVAMNPVRCPFAG
jgi:hypothetical protein